MPAVVSQKINTSAVEESERRDPGDRPRRFGIFSAAWISIAFPAAAAAPSPIYVLYQAQWHFDSGLLSVAFSVYAFTLLVALLSVGSLSDYLGRKPVLLMAIFLEVVAMALLLLAQDITHVMVARALQGFATGAATATVSAVLTDLSPTRNKQLGATIGSITPLVGLAIGALSAGIIIQTLPLPIPVVFVALIVLLLAGFVFIFATPDITDRRAGALSSLIPQWHLPPAARPSFLASSPLNVAVWLGTSLALGLLPQITRDVFGIHSGLANGGMIAMVTGAGAVAVLASRKIRAHRSALLACEALAAGGLIQGCAILTTSVGAFVVGCLISGLGVGLGFAGYIRLVIPSVSASERAGVFSAMYIVSYLTFGIPVVIAGVLIGHYGTAVVTSGYCALTVVVSGLGFFVLNHFTKRDSARS